MDDENPVTVPSKPSASDDSYKPGMPYEEPRKCNLPENKTAEKVTERQNITGSQLNTPQPFGYQDEAMESQNSSVNGVQDQSHSVNNSNDVIIIEDTSSKQTGSFNIQNSRDSDLELIETSQKKFDSSSANSSQEMKTDDTDNADSLTVFNESMPELKSFSDSPESFELFKSGTNLPDNADKFVSPVSLSASNLSKTKLNFESNSIYSTPKENEPLDLKIEPSKQSSFGEGKDAMNAMQQITKNFFLILEVSSVLHFDKENITGELKNISCDNFEQAHIRSSTDSEKLSDVSKATSPGSVTSHTVQLPYKLNRYSHVSSSSSSSAVSSASALTLRMLREGKLFSSKKDEPPLTEERIKHLKETWLNSDEVYKILDYIDKAAVSADLLLNLSSESKFKMSSDNILKSEQMLNIIKEVESPVVLKRNSPARNNKRPSRFKLSPVESDNDVPMKKAKQYDFSEIDLPNITFSPSDIVFAKWSDRKFYPGSIVNREPDGKWTVQFFDGDKKICPEEHILKANEFTLVGQNVYASLGDAQFSQGIITGCEFRDNVLHFMVARDKGDITVPPDFIYVTESQARQIRGKYCNFLPTVKGPSVSSDLLLGKRCTRSKTRSIVDNSRPGSSGMQRVIMDSDEDTRDAANDYNVDEVAGVEPESHGVYENGIKLKGKLVSGKMRFPRTKMNDIDADILGPLPEEGSKYFKNCHILFTCTRPHSPICSGDMNGSSYENSTDSEFYRFSNIPFVKNRLKLQLELGGAIVYTQFSEIQSKFWKNTYLVSNQPSTSAKYVQCLAVGIKIVCHEWVIRCCVEKKRVPLQELPLGWSLERQRYINFCERTKAYPFKKVKLLIVENNDKNHFKFWKTVSCLAGATVEKLTRDSNLEGVRAVICECGYRDEAIERAMSYNIPILTSVWLVQSLIHGEPRPIDGYKNYCADYIESD